jgi:hypothetical protein
MRSPLTEFVAQNIAYILDVKRLQQMWRCRRLPLSPEQQTRGQKRFSSSGNYCFSYLEGLLASANVRMIRGPLGRISAHENKGWPIQL